MTSLNENKHVHRTILNSAPTVVISRLAKTTCNVVIRRLSNRNEGENMFKVSSKFKHLLSAYMHILNDIIGTSNTSHIE